MTKERMCAACQHKESEHNKNGCTKRIFERRLNKIIVVIEDCKCEVFVPYEKKDWDDTNERKMS